MTPADEIRTAAAKLRSLIEDATEGPWASEDPSQRWGDDYDRQLVGGGKILATFNNDHNGPLNTDYAAAMHPGVGTALAAWLDSVAHRVRQDSQGEWIGADLHHALAVARAINRSQP